MKILILFATLLFFTACSGQDNQPAPPTPPPVVTPPTVTPPVTPPPTPPPAVVPPVVTPPPGPTPGDFSNAPFERPPQPVIRELPDARYVSLGCETCGTDPNAAPAYAGLAQYHNPLPGSHLYAGNLPNGMRLWIQSGASPQVIRYLLAGNLLPGNRWPK